MRKGFALFIKISILFATILVISFSLFRTYRYWSLRGEENLTVFVDINYCHSRSFPQGHLSYLPGKKLCLIRGVQVDPGFFMDKFYLIAYPRMIPLDYGEIKTFTKDKI